MNIKKTALTTAVALTVFGGSVLAETSTVSSQFIADRIEIPTGSVPTVNLSLLGLNKEGEVDRFGESDGSIIMGVVQTEIGEVGTNCGQSVHPGSTPSDPLPNAGGFASEVRYIRLNQGNGATCITYKAEVIGNETKTDRVTLYLQERIPTAEGGVRFVGIGPQITKTITVHPLSVDPEQLRIVSFVPSSVEGAVDPQGSADSDNLDGIYGVMTAGHEGGQITVRAENKNAAGEITVTLRPMIGTQEPYTFKQQMMPADQTKIDGEAQAIITLDASVTKSGIYYIEATFKDFDGNSVQMLNPDILEVKSTRKADKLSLWSPKQRIAKPDFDKLSGPAVGQVTQGTYFVVTILDEYGNETSPENFGDMTVKLQDSKGVVSGVSMVIADNASSETSDWLGNDKDEVIQLGTAELVATAVDKTTGDPLPITSSDTLSLTVTSGSVYVTGAPGTPSIVDAGTEFQFTDALYVATNEGKANPAIDPGPIVIKSVATDEELSVYRDDNAGVEALFREATAGVNEYLVSDKAGAYAQVLVNVAAIQQAAALKVEIRNAHNQVVTTINPQEVNTQYVTTIPAVSVKMSDDYGNAISPPKRDTGEFRVSTPNAANVNYDGTSGADYGTPSETLNGGQVKISYDKKGDKEFAGEDRIVLNFTKPGLGLSELTIGTIVPARKELNAINSFVETNNIPINSAVAITVEILDQNDEVLENQGTVVTVTFGGEDGDTFTPIVRNFAGELIVSGEALIFANGREVFVVEAGAQEGQFSLTFEDADKTVAAETRTITVAREIDGIDPPVNAGLKGQECADAGGIEINGKCETLPNVNNPESSDGTGNVGVLNPDGTITETSSAVIKGGISVEGGSIVQEAVINLVDKDTVSWMGNIKFDSDDIGEVVDIIVVANYFYGTNSILGGTKKVLTYNVTGGNEGETINVLTLDGEIELDELEAFISGHTITEENKAFLMYEGPFGTPPFLAGSNIDAYIGYRKQSDDGGQIIYNQKPITLRMLR